MAGLWWAYFDIVAMVAERRLDRGAAGEQGPLARDAYSYLHFPMIAGIVLLALGMKETLADVDEAARGRRRRRALRRGRALPRRAVAFRLRNVGTLNKHRASRRWRCSR